MFHLETPGGGGFGINTGKEATSPPAKRARVFTPVGSLSDYVLTQESA